ncbi:hypothetical protein VC83_05256 [Pseudogymnoascus destructans]|uniref:Uncharacterized protein n=2 Tax=Pseudogymnoascus destructans TaxID=655981 RepID=L8G1X3_PSED2|nr:uncharacterized protein VC83_05256 [Pseudogymnoascus destructans]ELR06683.1 hypothetical protein GMDG_00300 [Pseudogymnoascus destructans 20631-21]OAF58100.1 hypothetical protein VC83_05256 [Pseudogymnoascus destructans]
MTTITIQTKRKTMSITQTYYLAHSARGKLSTEASRSDRRLRRLVGHANLLDSLMLELANAEAEQESWFNVLVRGARKTEDRHIQWADSVVEEEAEEDWQVEDAESDSSDEEEEEEEVHMGFATLQRVKSHQAFDVTMIPSPADSESESDEDEDEDIYEDDGEEDYAMLSLQRTHSHPASPPDLIDEDDSSSEDEAMPPSPPADVMRAFPKAEARGSKVSPAKGQFFDEGFYLPQRKLVSAVSVY